MTDSPARRIAEALEERRHEVVPYLLPNGKLVGHEWCVGSLQGEPGMSCKVHLNGKGGVYKDFATGEKGGDILDLWAAVHCNGDIKAAMREAAAWLGMSLDNRADKREQEKKEKYFKKYETGKWLYHDKDGNPWIEIVRVDEPGKKKVFYQYDVKAGKWISSGGHQLPDPRPLYNLPAIAKTDDIVVLVEGEKCATALINLGYTSTATIGGAQAGEKTDYTPLAGKSVILWPDNDKAGKAYAEKVIKKLLTVGAMPYLVPLPEGKPEPWDVVDALTEGWSKEQIDELIAKAEPYEPPKVLKAVSWLDLKTMDLPPREPYLEPFLHRQTLAMIHAYRGVGKTLFGLGIAVSLATEGKFLKWQASQTRRVLYVDGELPAIVIQERLQAMMATASPAYASNLRFITPDLQENGIPDLATEEGQAAIEEHLDGVEVIFLDNLSTLVRSGKENDAESWQPIQDWLLSLRRRGISVIAVHHSGKNGLQRGASKREDVLDSVLHLKHPSDYQPTDGARFEVHFEKARLYRGGDALEPIEAQYEVVNGQALWTWKTCETAITDRVAELLNQGLSQHAIAKELGIGVSTVNRHKNKAQTAGKLKAR